MRFVRVVHRSGWEVELVGESGTVEKVRRDSREEALDYAVGLSPEWIEVGDIVGLDTPGQHHEWTTLRRGPDGSYAVSALTWRPPHSA